MKWFFTLLLCRVALAAFGQQERLPLKSINAGSGFRILHDEQFRPEDWKALPGFTDHETEGYSGGQPKPQDRYIYPVYSVGITLRLPEKQQLMLGFSLNAGGLTRAFTTFSNAHPQVYDTIHITTPDGTFSYAGYFDTLETYNYRYLSKMVHFSPRLTWQADLGKRFRCFTALQADFGTAFSTTLRRSYHKYVHGYPYVQLSYGMPEPLEEEIQTRKGKAPLHLGLTVPLGITFCLGKPESWWSRLSLSAEESASFFTVRTPEMKRFYSDRTIQFVVRIDYCFGGLNSPQLPLSRSSE